MQKLTLNTDFAPPFAELAGVEGFSADGRSLLSLLGGEEPSSSWRSSVLLEKLPPKKTAARAKPRARAKPKTKPKPRARVGLMVHSRAVSVVSSASRRSEQKPTSTSSTATCYIELYDLESDPYKLESIDEGADPALVEYLKANLEAFKTCSEEGCREAEDAS